MNSFRRSDIRDRMRTNAGKVRVGVHKLGESVSSLDWLLGSRDQLIPLIHDGLHPGPADIDDAWANSQPFRWGTRTHGAEREMLYSIMTDREQIEALTDGYLRLRSVAMNHSRVVSVATNKRLLLLRKGILRNYDAMEVNYGDIAEIDIGTLTVTIDDHVEEIVDENKTEYRRVRNEKEFVTLYFSRDAAPDFRLDIDDLDSVKSFVACLHKRI